MTDLLQDVEAYLARTGMAPTALGDGALNDRHFVRQLRAGRRTFRETESKVRAFMERYEREQGVSPDTAAENIGEAA